MNSTADSDLFDRLGRPARMRQIASYDLFAPGLRPRLDALATRTAARLHAPVSLISVVLDSAQFVLGRHGVGGWMAEIDGIPAEWSLCAHTVLAGRPYCVTDGATDPAHADNPLLNMTDMHSYAGVPLIDHSGQAIGAHCVIDVDPRTFTDDDLALLADSAAETMRILDEHRRS
ncbi:GAF domain-containing protein [Actinoplanes sp. NPDC026619]|uniref:GAF domain-containing protein n=1 Tax=Actinoplanes sp. NPDC026619 TaxID=3155798 RepID=UPI0033E23982